MNKENLKLIKYLGIIFITVILSYKIPHDSFSILQYIIKPIKLKNVTLYPSSIVTILLMIIGIIGLLKLERFEKKSKLLILFLILFFDLPFMSWTIDKVRTGYYTLINPGIQSIDIEESHISFYRSDDAATITVNLKLKNHNTYANKFRIRVYLPKTLSNYTGKEYLELKNIYETYGHDNTLSINEDIQINSINNSLGDLSISDWYYEDVRYELYNDSEKITIIDHGI